MRTREQILAQFPERDLDGVWEISPDADSRWRAAVLELLLDMRDHLLAVLVLPDDARPPTSSLIFSSRRRHTR